MNRRTWYIAGVILFLPLILWYASRFSDLPEMTFAEAALEEDHTKRVAVNGSLVTGANIVENGENSLTFYLVDSDGKKERVFYEGKEQISKDDVGGAEEISVIGHMCSDGEGPRFHAKQLYMSD